MAILNGTSEEKVYSIQRWLGLHESPSGDTSIKLGEAARMRNFQITREQKLRRRSGLTIMAGLSAQSVSVSSESTALKTETGVSSSVLLYPDISYAKGYFEAEGEAVTVTYATAESYAGYYLIRGRLSVWKFASCTYDQDTDIYSWNFYRVSMTESGERVAGIWSGEVGAYEYVLAACGGKLWKVYDGASWGKTELGSLDTTHDVHMFGFANKVYIQNGTEYKCWDGTTLEDVAGYVPLVLTAAAPAGGGTTLEQVNKLNGKRRVRFSPDGTATEFILPEKLLQSIDSVKALPEGTELSCEKDTANGKVTFQTAPAEGVNSLEVAYTAAENDRATVLSMCYSELYNGTQSNRVFLYGNGSNKAIYSTTDIDGTPRADYFPDMNEIAVGEDNTPITGMIRHYSRLAVFKPDSAWSINYGAITLADGSTAAAFYVTGINKEIGNRAPGQVCLVLNSPRTIHGNDVYEWKNGSSYTSNLTTDERQAKRISDRIYSTLSNFDEDSCHCWDHNDAQEYYICYDGQALVHNYAADAWYYYDHFDAECLTSFQGELYIGTSDGKINKLDELARTDNGETITARWESGSHSFGADFRRKFSSMIWIVMKPETASNVRVQVQTDRNSTAVKESASAYLSFFDHFSFSSFSFNSNSKPRTIRMKLKAKKFVFWKLVIESTEPDTAATVLAADIRVRFAGYAK